MGVWRRRQPDEQDDEEVAQNRGQVQRPGTGAQNALPAALARWEPQEEELGHAALVFPLHALLLSAGNEGQ